MIEVLRSAGQKVADGIRGRVSAVRPEGSDEESRVKTLPASALGGALWHWSRDVMVGLAVISGVINLLALTGSFYMLQVYDRVLGSRSLPTLVGLTLLMLMLYALYGGLDAVRSQVIARLGGRIDRQLRSGVLSAVLRSPLRSPLPGDGLQPIRDLDQIRAVMSGAGPAALFDIPWLPVYLALVFSLHPYLGMVATGGAAIMLAATVLTERRSHGPARAVAKSGAERQGFLDVARRNLEVIRAHGLEPVFLKRWTQVSDRHMDDLVRSVDGPGPLVAFSRIFRMALQSLILAVGAYVVIKGEASGGVIIASSIISGRALAPIESAIANWRGMVAARQAYGRLVKILETGEARAPANVLPPPHAQLSVEALSLAPPGVSRLVVQNVTFELKAGDGMGLIGPSASGKSSLARALVGVWLPHRGNVRLDGATLDHWSPEQLGPHIGYLPQDVEIFEGTIAENIARLESQPNPAKIVAAAQEAGIHEMILAMPQDYSTKVGLAGAALSAGQKQRLALARALYGDPFLVVLDEPNSNLDADGDAALGRALARVRERGGIVVVVAHRPSAIASLNKLMVMAGGQVQAFGEKDEVLGRMTQRAAGPALSVVAPQTQGRGTGQ